MDIGQTPSVSAILIRPGVPDDAEAIAAYHHRCSIAAFSDIVAAGTFDDLDPRRRVPTFTEWLGPQSEMTVRVAVVDDVAVGHVAVEGNEIVHLFIDPDHSGRGLGRRLLAVGEELIRDAGHDTLELHTIVGNTPAIRLYESAGWVVTDRLIHNEHEGLVYDEHVMIKTVTPVHTGSDPV